MTALNDTNAPTADPDKLMAFVFCAVEEAGAALNCALVVMGDRLGYYRSLADNGPSTPAELAERTNTDEHYAREWLNAQAAGSFVSYDPGTGRYQLPPEHAVALTDETSPAFVGGLFQTAHGTIADANRIIDVARTGDGVGWGDHNSDVHVGCERFFRPTYAAYLIDAWLPALERGPPPEPAASAAVSRRAPGRRRPSRSWTRPAAPRRPPGRAARNCPRWSPGKSCPGSPRRRAR
jgi:hypothetical protein